MEQLKDRKRTAETGGTNQLCFVAPLDATTSLTNLRCATSHTQYLDPLLVGAVCTRRRRPKIQSHQALMERGSVQKDFVNTSSEKTSSPDCGQLLDVLWTAPDHAERSLSGSASHLHPGTGREPQLEKPRGRLHRFLDRLG